MTRFNIIGTGFLDMAETAGLGFKTQNHFFRFSDISLGRSTEFSVPATDRNRQMLGFGEDPIEWGEMLRKVYPAQIVYDGGVKDGTLTVTSYEGNAFKCVFSIGNSEWIETVQKRKLADCPTSWTKGVLWALTEPVIDANLADPTQGAQLLNYDYGSFSPWKPAPSINIKAYIEDILGLLGIPYTIHVPKEYWLVSGSMKGGDVDIVTISSTAANNLTISQSQGYFTAVDIDIEWATHDFLFLSGGGSFNAKGLQATQDVSVVFPNPMPNYCYLVKWSSKLAKCEVLGGKGYNPAIPSDNVPKLDGQTIDLKKGDIVFFGTKMLNAEGYGSWIGWKDTYHPYNFTLSVARDTDLSLGEVWYMAYNHPDMTLFDFLKSVALATGMELVVDGETGVTIRQADYGPKYAKKLDKVISVDKVERVVDCWGNGTRKAVVSFDSEDYVTQKIENTYEVQNELPKDTKDVTIKFSEGNISSNGVLVEDVSNEGGVNKFVGKKFTIAYADNGYTYLQRIPPFDYVGYLDLSSDSTAVKVKTSSPLADLFDLEPTTTFLWRGIAFVWTDASWSDSVMTMTLQKVSQMPAPPDEE